MIYCITSLSVKQSFLCATGLANVVTTWHLCVWNSVFNWAALHITFITKTLQCSGNIQGHQKLLTDVSDLCVIDKTLTHTLETDTHSQTLVINCIMAWLVGNPFTAAINYWFHPTQLLLLLIPHSLQNKRKASMGVRKEVAEDGKKWKRRRREPDITESTENNSEKSSLSEVQSESCLQITLWCWSGSMEDGWGCRLSIVSNEIQGRFKGFWGSVREL